MKVKELRKILKRFPKDAQVIVDPKETSEVHVSASCDQDGKWIVEITSVPLYATEENVEK